MSILHVEDTGNGNPPPKDDPTKKPVEDGGRAQPTNPVPGSQA